LVGATPASFRPAPGRVSPHPPSRGIELGLADPSPDRVTEELAALGLLEYVRDFLPPDWSARGKLVEE
jgi:hypothetical protein